MNAWQEAKASMGPLAILGVPGGTVSAAQVVAEGMQKTSTFEQAFDKTIEDARDRGFQAEQEVPDFMADDEVVAEAPQTAQIEPEQAITPEDVQTPPQAETKPLPLSAERLTAQTQAAPVQEAVTEQDNVKNKGAAPSSGQKADTVKPWQELVTEKEKKAKNLEPGSTKKGSNVVTKSGKSTMVTGVSKAVNKIERKNLGMDPEAPAKRRPWAEESALVDKELEINPKAGEQLVDELSVRPRSLEERDVELLSREKQIRFKARNAAASETVAAHESGDESRIQKAETDLTKAAKELEQVFSVIKPGQSKTSTARALARMRSLIDEEFSLIEMEQSLRAKQKGEPVSKEQMIELKRQVAKYEEKSAKLERERDVEAKKNAEQKEELVRAKAELDYAEQREEVLLANKENVTFSDKVRKKTGDAAAKAMERINNRRAMFTMNLDPTAVVDLAIVGADFITNGALDAASFSKAMIAKFGEKIKPFLVEIRAKAMGLVREAQKATSTDKKVSEKGETKEETFPQQLKRLFKEQAEDGVENVYEAAKNVLDIVKAENPDITMVPMLDAYGDYGKQIKKNKNPIKKTLAHWRAKIQRLSKLARASKGIRPKKRGSTFEKPDVETRSLDKRLNSFLKVLKSEGVDVVSDEAHAKSTLDGMKTRARNEIEDLEDALKTETKIVTDKNATPSDAELVLIKEKLAGLRERYNLMFPKSKGKSVEQKLDTAIKGAERSRDAQKKKLDDAKKGRWKKKKNDPVKANQRLKQIRAERDAIKAEIKKLHDLKFPPMTPIERAIDTKLKRIKRSIREGKRQIATGDFSRKAPAEVDISGSPAAMNAARELAMVRQDVARFREEARRKARGWVEVVAETGIEAGKTLENDLRSVLSGFDVSALRQAWQVAVNNPIFVAKRLPKLFSSLNRRQSQKMNQKIRELKHYRNGNMKTAKVALMDDGGTGDFSGQVSDDITLQRFSVVERIPGVKMSNRAFGTWLNVIRADLFQMFAENSPNPDSLTTKDLHEIGLIVNTLSGKGSFEKLNMALRPFTWAPSLISSGLELPVNMITGRKWAWGGTPTSRSILRKQYMKTVANTALMYLLYNLFKKDDDPPVETDLRSTYVGGIPIGKNYLFNPLGNSRTQLVFLSRLLTGQIKTGSGEIQNLRSSDSLMGLPFATDEEKAQKPLYGRGVDSLMMYFGRSKAAPLGGNVITLLSGKKFNGGKQTWVGFAKDAVTPLNPKEIAEIAIVEDMDATIVLSLLNSMGVPIQRDYRKKEFSLPLSIQKYMKDHNAERLFGRSQKSSWMTDEQFDKYKEGSERKLRNKMLKLLSENDTDQVDINEELFKWRDYYRSKARAEFRGLADLSKKQLDGLSTHEYISAYMGTPSDERGRFRGKMKKKWASFDARFRNLDSREKTDFERERHFEVRNMFYKAKSLM